MKKKGIYRPNIGFLLLGLIFCSNAYLVIGQLDVTSNNNANTLATKLVGNGVTISNAQLLCHGGGSGIFDGQAADISLDGGIILSTGNAVDAEGPNTQDGDFLIGGKGSTDKNGPGDNRFNGATFDRCLLRFDLEPSTDSIEFEFVFASEEYHEYASGGSFIDAFGFFISGPGIAGEENIAVIPGTNVPINVTTINRSVRPEYLVSNREPIVYTSCEYDGWTTVLKAAKGNLDICSSYHLEMVIVDGGDGFLDGAVFLGENSLNSVGAIISEPVVNGSSSNEVIEGCEDFEFTVELVNPLNKDFYALLSIGGTATNGVDYTEINDSILFEAGETTHTFNINVFTDGFAEGDETIEICLFDPCTGVKIDNSCQTITIKEFVGNVSQDETICKGQDLDLEAEYTVGSPTVTWEPSTYLSCSNCQYPSCLPDESISYTVTIDNGSGCVFIDTVDIVVVETDIDLVDTLYGCWYESITADISLPGFTSYTWSPGTYLSNPAVPNPNITVSNELFQYTLTLSSDAGCTASDVINVKAYPEIEGIINATDVLCFGDSTGSLSFIAGNQTVPGTFEWSNQITSNPLPNMPAGNYRLTLTDVNGCTGTFTAGIKQPQKALKVSLQVQNAASCTGNNGRLRVGVTGGTAPYTYDWSNGASGPDNSGIPGGTYNLVVTDDNGCSVSGSYEVELDSDFDATFTFEDISCAGFANGEIKVQLTGGDAPYDFIWQTPLPSKTNTNDLSHIQSGLPPGTFNVTVSDANGCSMVLSSLISEPKALKVQLDLSHVLCPGGSNGSASAEVTGGTLPYQFLWSPGSSKSDSIGNLKAGNQYQFQVTDDFGCQFIQAFEITDPEDWEITIDPLDVKCNGESSGRLNVEIQTGGTPPYEFLWSNNATTEDLVDIPADFYELEVIDAFQCKHKVSAVIKEPEKISYNIVEKAPICSGFQGELEVLNISGGKGSPYAVTWTQMSTGIESADNPFTGINSGDYQVKIQDAAGCIVGESYKLIADNLPVPVNASISHVRCNGESNGVVSLIPQDPAQNISSVIWPDLVNSNPRSGLIADTYDLQIIDGSGCVDQTSVTVSQPAQISATFTTDSLSCYGKQDGSLKATIEADPNPQRQFFVEWSIFGSPAVIGTGDSLDGLAIGTYRGRVFDAEGCEFLSSALNLSQPDPMNTSVEVDSARCYQDTSGEIRVKTEGGNGGNSYHWENAFGVTVGTNNKTVGQLVAGDYFVTVTDRKSCIAENQGTIGEPTDYQLMNISITPLLCNGIPHGAISISLQGNLPPYNFSWENSLGQPAGTESLIEELLADNYFVEVTNRKGECPHKFGPFSVSQPNPISVETEILSPGICEGLTGSAKAVPSGGIAPYDFYWCNGTSQMNLNQAIVNSLPDGPCELSVNDANGCKFDHILNIPYDPGDLDFKSTTSNPVCKDSLSGSVTIQGLNGTQPYTLQWIQSGSDQFAIDMLGEGSYSFLLKDANGCELTNSVQLVDPPVPQAILHPVMPSCNAYEDGFILVQHQLGKAPYNYTWDHGPSGPQWNPLEGLKTGSYGVNFTDANNCPGEYTAVFMDEPVAIKVTAGIDKMITRDLFTTLSVNVSPPGKYTYHWSPAELMDDPSSTRPLVFPDETTTFTIVVSDGLCFGEDSLTVEVIPYSPVIIPSAFSPDGDGLNDHFRIQSDALQSFALNIFNRWGQLVYYTTDPNDHWDGRSLTGGECQVGTYAYSLRVADRFGDIQFYGGNVTLIR